MSIFKKAVLIIAFIIGVLFVASIVVLWQFNGEVFFWAPDYKQLNSFMRTNFNELSYVADALSKMNYDSITIRKDSVYEEAPYSMKVSREYLVYETVPVPDELINHIDMLFSSGIRVISYGGEQVNFSVWSTMDESRGIMYSITGSPPSGEQLIEVRQLSNENWYYYVHNYEKAKKLNPEKFE